jgi:hypothetical protein
MITRGKLPRRTWCIQDACGHWLVHCEHIVGEHIDQRTAIALAKAMIRDGRMPTPEEAERQLQKRQLQEAQLVLEAAGPAIKG